MLLMLAISVAIPLRTRYREAKKMPFQCLCPKCQNAVDVPFPQACPYCGFSLDHLTGKKLSDFQKGKKDKHGDLLYGRNISLRGSEFNASFDSYGDANLEDIVRFAMSYGHRILLPGKAGRASCPLVVGFIPNVVGSGISVYDKGYEPVACSGVAVVSPQSEIYGHPIPALDAWVDKMFAGKTGYCGSCGDSTPFGHPICAKCYAKNGQDWRHFL